LPPHGTGGASLHRGWKHFCRIPETIPVSREAVEALERNLLELALAAKIGRIKTA